MTGVKALRALLHELREASYANRIQDSLATRYLFEQYRNFQCTDQQLCKGQNEVRSLAENYRIYISSRRNYNELYSEYRGCGERGIKETAEIVGFKLPTDPK